MSLIVTNHHASVHLGSSGTGGKHPNTSTFVLKYINGVMGQLILLSKKRNQNYGGILVLKELVVQACCPEIIPQSKCAAACF